MLQLVNLKIGVSRFVQVNFIVNAQKADKELFKLKSLEISCLITLRYMM